MRERERERERATQSESESESGSESESESERERVRVALLRFPVSLLISHSIVQLCRCREKPARVARKRNPRRSTPAGHCNFRTLSPQPHVFCASARPSHTPGHPTPWCPPPLRRVLGASAFASCVCCLCWATLPNRCLGLCVLCDFGGCFGRSAGRSSRRPSATTRDRSGASDRPPVTAHARAMFCYIVGRARGADMLTHAGSVATKRWEDLWFWVGICCLDSTWLMWCGMLSQDAWRCL